MNNRLLKSPGGAGAGGSVWQWDAVNEYYYLEIDGVVVAIIDGDGNLRIKGRVLKYE